MQKRNIRTKRKLAVFDIDGTIFRSSLLIEVVEALIQEGIFPDHAKKVYAPAFQRWLDRKGNYDAYINAVVRAAETYIVGVPAHEYERVAKRVVAFHKDRVYRYTRDLVRALRKKNYYIIAISNSPKHMVDAFARAMGFDSSYGRIYETDARGQFTGRTHLELFDDKAELLRHIVARDGLSLKGSVGVGDSEGDISLLGLVDRPICFNPNSILYKHAKRKRWEIVVERKDMVYHLH